MLRLEYEDGLAILNALKLAGERFAENAAEMRRLGETGELNERQAKQLAEQFETQERDYLQLRTRIEDELESEGEVVIS